MTLGHSRDRRRRRRHSFAVLEKVIDQRVAMNPVHRQNNHHDEVRRHDRHIEGIQLVKPLERIRQRIEISPPIIRHRVRRRRERASNCVHPGQDAPTPKRLSLLRFPRRVRGNQRPLYERAKPCQRNRWARLGALGGFVRASCRSTVCAPAPAPLHRAFLAPNMASREPDLSAQETC